MSASWPAPGVKQNLVTVPNWWPRCSKASIGSALQVCYRVHVIVSDTQNDPPAEPFL